MTSSSTYTDLPVKFEDLRIGDYILGFGYITGDQYEGFYRRPSEDRPNCPTISNKICDPSRLERRHLTTDPSFILTNPEALAPGDVIKFQNKGGSHVIQTSGKVLRTETRADGRLYVVTDGVGAGSEDRYHIWRQATPVATVPQYPTIYHLKAAIWDLARAKYLSKDWCTNVNRVLDQLTICHVDNASAGRARDQVDDLTDRVHSRWSDDLGISRQAFEDALKSLGITPKPQVHEITVTVQVPVDLTAGDVVELVQNAVTKTNQENR